MTPPRRHDQHRDTAVESDAQKLLSAPVGSFEASRTRLVGVALVAVAQAVIVGSYVAESWFFVDDFAFLRQARDTHLEVKFLRLALFEHFSPVHRTIDWLFVRTVGLSWTGAAILLTGLAVTCTVAFAYALSPLVRSSRVLVGTTAAYAISLFFIRNAVWYTHGVHLLTATLFGLLTIGSYVRWQRERRPYLLALAAVTLTLAVLTHEQALLLIGMIGLIRVVMIEPRPRSVRAVGQTLWAERVAWLLFAFITALGVANFAAFYYIHSERPSLGPLLEYFWASTGEGFFATLLLVKVPEAEVGGPLLTGLLATTLFLGLVGLTIALRRRSLGPWIGFGVYLLVSTFALGLNRVVQFGPAIGREPRYHMFVASFFMLTLGVVLDGPRRRRVVRFSTRVALGAAVAVVACYLILFVRAAPLVREIDWQADVSERYFSHFYASLTSLRAAGTEPVLVDGIAPEGVVPAWLFPFNRHSMVLTLFDPGLRFDGPGRRFEVNSDGVLVPTAGASESGG